MTNKVEIGKKYKTRSGMAARVICIDTKNPTHPVIALVTDGELEHVVRLAGSGQYYTSTPGNGYDLIEVSPWNDFKVDEPVMVRDSAGSPWCPRHFAEVVYGKPCTWDGGKTSWSAQSKYLTHWQQCRRPTEEELQTKAIP